MFYELSLVLAQAEPLDHAADARRQVGQRDPGEKRVPPQRAAGAPARWDRQQLGQVADAVLLDVPPRRCTIDRHRSRARGLVAEEQADERALARAIRSGKPEHLSGPHLETEVAHRRDGSAAQRAI